MIDLENPVVKLCLAGTQAEFDRRLDEAKALYQRAWTTATNDYEACIAAHYVARFPAGLEDALYWNQEALKRAQMLGDGQAQEFYPSLYLSLGRAYENLGNPIEAQRYYRLAADLGFTHHED